VLVLRLPHQRRGHDGRLFRRNQPPASTLLRGTVVSTSPPIDLGPLARADFANGHDVRFCWDCKTELDQELEASAHHCAAQRQRLPGSLQLA